ncbi:MAG TPA: cytochrome c oxidase subunit 3 family protein [Blastocatellia bacterium]|nr:cytochrome c oxidase subunit 3 family protein [Blastocatellia bacterium]
MSDVQTTLAHQFEDPDQQHEAASLGMWAFLITEIMFFGGLFAAYTVYRIQYPAAFVTASHLLDYKLGAVNTAVLICSSLTMALAVRAAQLGQRRNLIVFLILTMTLGTTFLGIKAAEYTHKFHERLIPGPNFTPNVSPNREAQLFFLLYYSMTGLHALHMVIGIGVLTWLLVRAVRGHFSHEYYSPVEMSGLYWHFVDIVWIYLFPLLYLVR